MSVTKLNDIINPEVMGDMINAKIEAQLKLTKYAKLNTKLQGVPGDTLTIPAWGYIGDAEDFDVEAGGEIETTNLTATSKSFTVKCAAKSVSIYQTAINSGLGNPVGQAETQLSKAIAGKVDNDVLDAALDADMIYDGTAGVIDYKGIVGANAKFQDEEDGIEKVMFIHPLQESQLILDDDFLSADKFESGVAVNGAIGKIAGCWIKKSRKVPAVDAIEAVKGVYTVAIGGTVASGDKITVAGVTVTLDGTSGATATAAATAVATALNNHAVYSVTRSTSTLTLTEKDGKEGFGAPDAEIESTSGTVTVNTTTEGVAGAVAHYENPIIKLEPDSAETEYTEDELPAITIFLKKDTQTDHEWFPKKQRHDITASRYYGVALTNSAKVVIAKFAQSVAE